MCVLHNTQKKHLNRYVFWCVVYSIICFVFLIIPYFIRRYAFFYYSCRERSSIFYSLNYFIFARYQSLLYSRYIYIYIYSLYPNTLMLYYLSGVCCFPLWLMHYAKLEWSCRRWGLSFVWNIIIAARTIILDFIVWYLV